MNALNKSLRRDIWSPELAGVALGLVFIASVWLSGHTPGSSGTFFKIASVVGQPLTVDNPMNTYFSRTFTPITQGLNWQVYLLIGVAAGAFVSALLSRGVKLTLVPDIQWKQVFGGAVWKRWAIAFGSAILIQIGAGIAGGCTSGLALAGGMQLIPAAFFFIPAIFITGTVVQWLLYGKNY